MRRGSICRLSAALIAAAGLTGCAMFDDDMPKSADVFAQAHNTMLSTCVEQRDAGQISFVAAAVCSNDITVKAFREVDYWYMDLVTRIDAERLAQAERVDKKEISPNEYRVKLMQVWSAAIREESLRVAPFGSKPNHPVLLGQADLFL